eukprot:scaffold80_cov325-Pavlova_lutheri.AAC.20
MRPSGSGCATSNRPTGTSILGPPQTSTAYAPPTDIRSAYVAFSSDVPRRASLTSSMQRMPRLSPPFSGRLSSKRIEPFAPPVSVAASYVPASWKAKRSSTGAFVCGAASWNAFIIVARRSSWLRTPASAQALDCCASHSPVAAMGIPCITSLLVHPFPDRVPDPEADASVGMRAQRVLAMAVARGVERGVHRLTCTPEKGGVTAPSWGASVPVLHHQDPRVVGCETRITVTVDTVIVQDRAGRPDPEGEKKLATGGRTSPVRCPRRSDRLSGLFREISGSNREVLVGTSRVPKRRLEHKAAATTSQHRRCHAGGRGDLAGA